MADSRYDLFISYAREDTAWVREHLHARLLLCRTREGRQPRVFLDTSEVGVRAGSSFVRAIETALAASDRFVPVYTRAYFAAEMCEWELDMALQIDPTGRLEKIVPVLADAGAAELVPLRVSSRNWLDARAEDWFRRLCATLGLTQQQAAPRLEFLHPVPDVRADATFAPVRVQIRAADDACATDAGVTLAAEHGGLQGTLTVPTARGVATFTDLLCTVPAPSTRLVAFAEGAVAAYSDPFAVREREEAPAGAVPSPRGAEAVLPRHGEAVFFDDERAVAVVSPAALEVFDLRGERLAGAPLQAPVRLVRRAGAALVAAEWSGAIHLCFSDGRRFHWPSPGGGERLAVPGDVRVADGRVLAGGWDGRVVALEPERDPVVVLRHEAGVQGLAEAGGLVFVSDLEGALCIYEGTRLVQSVPTEPVVRLVQPFAGCVVLVGETRMYHLPLGERTVFVQPLPIGPAAAVVGGVAFPVVVDARGRGVTVDEDLAVRTAFHVAAGAVPVSADREARRCVFRNRDGTRSLMVDGRVTTSRRGTLAVSPSGERFAVGDGARIRLLDAAEFAPLAVGEPHA